MLGGDHGPDRRPRPRAPAEPRAGPARLLSDARLRELRRAFQEEGTLESEAAYLTEAARCGTLAEHALAQAADLGHPAARRALGLEPFSAEDLSGLGRLLRERWGQWPLIKASRALAQTLLPQEDFASGHGLVVQAALEALEHFLAGDLPAWHLRPQLRAVQDPELQAWGGPGALALRETVLAACSPPPRGSWSDRAYGAFPAALAALGLEGAQAALATEARVLLYPEGQST